MSSTDWRVEAEKIVVDIERSYRWSGSGVDDTEHVLAFAARYAEEKVAEERRRFEPIYDCSSCGLAIRIELAQRHTIMCPDCKTYTAAVRSRQTDYPA